MTDDRCGRWSSVSLPAMIALCVAVLGCGGGGGDSKPKATDPPDVGSYEDPYDFEGFAQELDGAVTDSDLSFFLENVRFEDVPCSEDRPLPPASCAGNPPDATVPAILLSAWQADDSYLDQNQYESFIREFLAEHAADETDAYGSGEPRLYAYGIIEAGLQASPVEGETVEAIVTRIAATGSGTERQALLVSTAFDGDRWTVTRLTTGPAAFLEPSGPESAGGGADSSFEFWRLWED